MTRPTPQGRRVDSSYVVTPDNSRPDPVSPEQRRKAAVNVASTAIGLDHVDDLASVLAHLGLLPEQEGLWQ